MAAINSAESGVGSVSIPNAHLRDGGEVFNANDHYNAKQCLMAMSASISPGSHAVQHKPSSLRSDHHRHGMKVQRPLSQQLLVEATGTITPLLLAKHHLPSILLQHGPLAIRHITAHLIQTLPGFSSIPPARQRRLVVGSLEGRGGSAGYQGEVGGLDGDVVFEKVGWGRWDARKKGDPPRERLVTDSPSSPRYIGPNGLLSAEMHPSHSYAGESGIFVQSEEEISHDDMDAGDRMDPDDDANSSEDDDMTDEEDWAQMGAAMLRQHGDSPITSDGWTNSFQRSPGAGWSTAKKLTTESAAEKRAREEREAVEALVKLSSV